MKKGLVRTSLDNWVLERSKILRKIPVLDRLCLTEERLLEILSVGIVNRKKGRSIREKLWEGPVVSFFTLFLQSTCTHGIGSESVMIYLLWPLAYLGTSFWIDHTCDTQSYAVKEKDSINSLIISFPKGRWSQGSQQDSHQN